jgi:hypothetical protein
MKSKLIYVELKSGYGDDGPAWIGKAEFSKSGRTIYFNGKAFKSLKGNGISGNYYDLETDDEYWISGIKKNGEDRHWAGSGKVMIDESVIEEYLELTGNSKLDKKQFEITTLQQTDKSRFADLENEKMN